MARPDFSLEAICDGDRRWRFVVSGPYPSPDFLAGLVEARLRERGMAGMVEVLSVRIDGYELGIRW